MKLRIKVCHDCFEGTYYVVQKRVFLFFWTDLSGWIFNIDKAIEIRDIIQNRADLGIIC